MTPRAMIFGVFLMVGTVALGGFSLPFWRWFHELCASDTVAADLTTTAMLMGFGGIVTVVMGRAFPSAAAWACSIPLAPPKRARLPRSRPMKLISNSKR